MKFEVDKFYELMVLESVLNTDIDAEIPGAEAGFRVGMVARCVGFEFRKVRKSRGRYAKLTTMIDGKVVAFYERVSKNDIGRGAWLELEPLVVLARAEETGAL